MLLSINFFKILLKLRLRIDVVSNDLYSSVMDSSQVLEVLSINTMAPFIKRI